MTQANLERCPHCGGTVELIEKDERLGVIKCPDTSPCMGSGLGNFIQLDRKDEAIRAWNTRVTEARAQGLVDAAQTFTDRLKSIHEHPAYKSVWMVNQAHYGPYDPQYTDELEALETALATWRRT